MQDFLVFSIVNILKLGAEEQVRKKILATSYK